MLILVRFLRENFKKMFVKLLKTSNVQRAAAALSQALAEQITARTPRTAAQLRGTSARCTAAAAAAHCGHVPPLFQSHVKNFFCAKEHYSNAIEKRE